MCITYMNPKPKQAKWAKERLEKRDDAPDEEGGDCASKGSGDASKGLKEEGGEATPAVGAPEVREGERRGRELAERNE